MKRILPFIMWLALFAQAHAVQPDEMLPDPALEARARALSAGFRCLVCQNESIDESNATLAKDLRVMIREHLAKGESDQQVTDFLVSRYGEYVLLKPRLSARTFILWSLPFAIVIIGLLMIFRRRVARPAESESPLNEQERAELHKMS